MTICENKYLEKCCKIGRELKIPIIRCNDKYKFHRFSSSNWEEMYVFIRGFLFGMRYIIMTVMYMNDIKYYLKNKLELVDRLLEM